MADRGILDDTSLLDLLIKDLEVASEPWRITPYWATYHERLIREIKKSGLASLQNNYQLLKGFASGGPPTVIKPISVFSWSGSSMVFNNSTLDNA